MSQPADAPNSHSAIGLKAPDPPTRLRTEVGEILQCCALSTGLTGVGVVADLGSDSRLIHEFGDAAACRDVASNLDSASAPAAVGRGSFGTPDESNWWLVPISEKPTRLRLVGVAGHPASIHPETDTLVELFARQIAARFASANTWFGNDTTVNAPAASTEQHWRALQLSSEAVVALDSEMRFSYLNAAAEVLFSSSRDELIGRSALDTFPPSPPTEEAFRKALVYGETTTLKDYSLSIGAWLETRVFPSPDGVLVYIRDVTERHEQREELRRSEERFRLFSAATNDALWDWDIQENTLEWGDAIEQITGYSKEHLSDPEVWGSYVHPDDIGTLAEAITRTQGQSGPMAALEYRFRHANGEEIHLSVRGELYRSEDGTPTRLLGGVSDVTERHRLTAHLMRADRLETLGRLASSIAHDLNNLLTPIMLSLSVIQANKPGPEVMEEIELIKTSVDCGADLTRRLLSFARGNDSERKLADLSVVATEVHRLLKSSMPSSVEFTLELEPELPVVSCDPSQMHQVMTNLCINARDAISDGGTVTLRLVRSKGGTKARGRHVPQGDYVRISVTDTGCGIPAETLESIFEPFYTTKPMDEGTGLGLATVQSIVESHRGFLDVQSQRETTFDVWVPATT